ncbi:MAG TPA: hypothetical protein VJN18_28895 [Polyangiaceae bacterium]|nr:hypothetical protein [Polyangiaceae bacterium]
MQIPKLFYGRRGEAKSRLVPIIKALASGAELETWDFGPTMVSSEVPSAALLVNPGRIASDNDDFHCYALLYGLMEATYKRGLDRRYFDDAFAWSLDTPWSFVGTLGEAGGVFILKLSPAAFAREPKPELLRGKPEWYGPYLRATLRHWDALVAEGPRFAEEPMGSRHEFTGMTAPLGAILGDCGVVRNATDGDTSSKILAAIHRALAIIDDKPSG